MTLPVLMTGEDKAWIDAAKVIRFWPVVPVDGTPTYKVTHQGVTLKTGNGTLFGASTAISSIAADRRTLTLGADPTASIQGLMGEWAGVAILHDESTFGTIQVRVQNVSTVTVTLADALPHGTTLTAATLRLVGWSATLSTVDVTGTARRNCLVTWTYTQDLGTDYGTEVKKWDHLLHVVPRPFAIGMTQERLLTLVPGFARMMPGRQETWLPQLAEAERTVVKWLRALDTDTVEDQYHGGEFDEVAALLAASIILAGQFAAGADREAQAELYADDARKAFDVVLQNLQWLDTNNDGEPDSGEENVQKEGIEPGLVGGLTSGDVATTVFDPSDFPVFRRSGEAAFGKNH